MRIMVTKRIEYSIIILKVMRKKKEQFMVIACCLTMDICGLQNTRDPRQRSSVSYLKQVML